MRIPSRIWQTWKHKNNIPPLFEYWSSSFRTKNPAFIYQLWDDHDNRNFIYEHFPWFADQYDSYSVEICRVDAVRYFYLYLFGGLYADIDTECLRPLDDMLGISDVLLGRMGSDPNFSHSIPNAILASAPRQEFWLLVISLLIASAEERWPPEYLTGPALLKRAVEMYLRPHVFSIDNLISPIHSRLRDNQRPQLRPSTIRILEKSKWYALDWSRPDHQLIRQAILKGQLLTEDQKVRLCGDAWMVTYWAHSW